MRGRIALAVVLAGVLTIPLGVEIEARDSLVWAPPHEGERYLAVVERGDRLIVWREDAHVKGTPVTLEVDGVRVEQTLVTRRPSAGTGILQPWRYLPCHVLSLRFRATRGASSLRIYACGRGAFLIVTERAIDSGGGR